MSVIENVTAGSSNVWEADTEVAHSSSYQVHLTQESRLESSMTSCVRGSCLEQFWNELKDLCALVYRWFCTLFQTTPETVEELCIPLETSQSLDVKPPEHLSEQPSKHPLERFNPFQQGTNLEEYFLRCEQTPGMLSAVIAQIQPEDLSPDHFFTAFKRANEIALTTGQMSCLDTLLAHRFAFFRCFKQEQAHEFVTEYLEAALPSPPSGVTGVGTFYDHEWRAVPHVLAYWQVVAKYLPDVTELLKAVVEIGKDIVISGRVSWRGFYPLIQSVLASPSKLNRNPMIHNLPIGVFCVKRTITPPNKQDMIDYCSAVLRAMAQSGKIDLLQVDMDGSHALARFMIEADVQNLAELDTQIGLVNHIQLQEVRSAISLAGKEGGHFNTDEHFSYTEKEVAYKRVCEAFERKMRAVFLEDASANPYLCIFSKTIGLSIFAIENTRDIHPKLERQIAQLEPKARQIIAAAIATAFEAFPKIAMPSALIPLMAAYYPFGIQKEHGNFLV